MKCKYECVVDAHCWSSLDSEFDHWFFIGSWRYILSCLFAPPECSPWLFDVVFASTKFTSRCWTMLGCWIWLQYWYHCGIIDHIMQYSFCNYSVVYDGHPHQRIVKEIYAEPVPHGFSARVFRTGFFRGPSLCTPTPWPPPRVDPAGLQASSHGARSGSEVQALQRWCWKRRSLHRCHCACHWELQLWVL